LEKGRFGWPVRSGTEPEALRMVSEELSLLLSGIDLDKTRSRQWWRKTA
jgi:hypothetical protein